MGSNYAIQLVNAQKPHIEFVYQIYFKSSFDPITARGGFTI
jgi:hypothetical protein